MMLAIMTQPDIQPMVAGSPDVGALANDMHPSYGDLPRAAGHVAILERPEPEPERSHAVVRADKQLRHFVDASASAATVGERLDFAAAALTHFGLPAAQLGEGNGSQLFERMVSAARTSYREFCAETKETLRGDHAASMMFALLGSGPDAAPLPFAQLWQRVCDRHPFPQEQAKVRDEFFAELTSYLQWCCARLNYAKDAEAKARTRNERIKRIPWRDTDRWRPLANCAGVDTDEFDYNNEAGERRVAIFCGPCVVRKQCLAYALATGQEYYIWGGLSPRSRNALRAKRRAAS